MNFVPIGTRFCPNCRACLFATLVNNPQNRDKIQRVKMSGDDEDK